MDVMSIPSVTFTGVGPSLPSLVIIDSQKLREKEMARPIEATPVLRGKDAARFVKATQNPKPYVAPTFDLTKMHQEVKKFIDRRASK